MQSEIQTFTQIRGNTRWDVDYRVPSAPWRVVWHTVEGDPRTVSGMNDTARGHKYGPHFWVSPRLKHRIQTVPIDKCASALLHPSGTIETNHMKAIQIEQFGFASQTQDWSPEWNDWLGEFVLAEIVRAIDGQLNLDYVEQTYGAGDGIILATKYSPIRHNEATWAGCNWNTTHQRIINNDHWDCGRFNLARVVYVAKETLGGAQPVDPLPPITDEGGLTVSEADRVIKHMDNILLKDMQARTDAIAALVEKETNKAISAYLANQKTAILYRIEGTDAPWYGLVGGKVIGPLDFDDAVEFKRQHEISENSIIVSQAWHNIYSADGVVNVSDKSVQDIVDGVSSVNAEFLNGIQNSDELAQKIAQQVVVQVGESNKEVLRAIADALNSVAS